MNETEKFNRGEWVIYKERPWVVVSDDGHELVNIRRLIVPDGVDDRSVRRDALTRKP